MRFILAGFINARAIRVGWSVTSVNILDLLRLMSLFICVRLGKRGLLIGRRYQLVESVLVQALQAKIPSLESVKISKIRLVILVRLQPLRVVLQGIQSVLLRAINLKLKLISIRWWTEG